MIENDVAAAVASDAKQLTVLLTWKKVRIERIKKFGKILRLKYHNDEQEINKNEEYEWDRLIALGLKKLEEEETGYEIIHDEKTADKRVLKKLGRIAFELFEINTYPKIDALVLSVVLNKALGNMDPRSMKKYRKTVLYYCNVDEVIIDRCSDSRLGELDVSGFVRRVPSSYVVSDLR